ncbi:MAG TPA: hypothetical protein VJ488_00515, partial [Dehalococcoidia bacterium]|nr:hypothetical protein [Dehalococcoidia bacterium]
LPAGVFNNYKVRRQAEGGSLAHLRPPHINPPDIILSQLGIEQELQETEKLASNRLQTVSK